MNTKFRPKSSEQGSTLIIALFLTTILAVSIAGYLKHANQQHFISMRSQVWNSSIAVSEAGVEEALQHLNSNSTNLSANGWTQSGNNYSVLRTLNGSSRYYVEIDASNMSAPRIVSVAYITPPSFAKTAVDSMMAAIGINAPTFNDVDLVSRAIRVKAGRDGLFLKAMVAKYKIDMNGNNVMTDSFDSTNPNYSDNGKYPAGKWWKLRDNGDVASNDTVANTINVGNANIYGHVAVGPGGSIAVGSNGGVGTRAWQAWNTGIQDGYASYDMNFTFPTITLPYTTTGLTPNSGSISTTNYTYSGSTNTVTTNAYPSPPPASGVTTNYSYVTVSTPPNPPKNGTVTNVLTTYTSSKDFPASGTYVGTPAKQGSKWYYDKITGYSYTYPVTTYTYTTGTVTTNSTVTTKYYDYILQGSSPGMPPVDYYVSSLNKANIYVQGNARLVVQGDVKQSGQETLVVASDGKLEMFVGGSSVDLTGQGVVNHNGFAQNFMLWCTDNVTSLKYAGNGEFTGIVVAPNAAVNLSGGGSGDQDYVGALVAKTITLNGHYKFHYDEALRNLDKNGRYKITEWNEISIAELESSSP